MKGAEEFLTRSRKYRTTNTLQVFRKSHKKKHTWKKITINDLVYSLLRKIFRFRPCQRGNCTTKIMGSYVLKAPAVECRSVPAIDTRPTYRSSMVDTRSTCRSTLGRYVGRVSVDSRWIESYFSQTLHRVSIDTSGDHSVDISIAT